LTNKGLLRDENFLFLPKLYGHLLQNIV